MHSFYEKIEHIMNGRELPRSNGGIYKNHRQSQAMSEWMFSFEGGKKAREECHHVCVALNWRAHLGRAIR